MNIIKKHKTPWDADSANARDAKRLGLCFAGVSPAKNTSAELRRETFVLYGSCVLDPEQHSSEELRQFLWTGLRLLRQEAQARGLPEEELQDLLARAFDDFYDASEAIWAALKELVSREPSADVSQEEELPALPPAVAVAEARPTPIKIRRQRRLTLLNPNAEILSRLET